MREESEINMKTNCVVHCYLCVLKDRCEFCASGESYKFYHWYGCGDYPLSWDEDDKLDLATLNCPIRKLVEETEERKAKP